MLTLYRFEGIPPSAVTPGCSNAEVVSGCPERCDSTEDVAPVEEDGAPRAIAAMNRKRRLRSFIVTVVTTGRR